MAPECCAFRTLLAQFYASSYSRSGKGRDRMPFIYETGTKKIHAGGLLLETT